MRKAKDKRVRIVFFGTPDFAAESLNRLISEGFDVAAVFTRPDRPKNRGMKTGFSPVKEAAEKAGLPLYQPENLKDGPAGGILRELAPELLVVVAYGKILPDEFIAAARKGAVNLHPSILPKYRGAAPIQRAVINGEKMTGVTVMYLSDRLDAGDIIYTEKTQIGESETADALKNRLSALGAGLLCKAVRDIYADNAPRTPQDEQSATYAPPLKQCESAIDWEKSPGEIINLIRGLRPWPTATAEFGGVVFKIFAAETGGKRTDKPPGTITSRNKGGLEVSCGNGEHKG